jgi:hypothetical protein
MAENNLFQLAQVVTELPLHRYHLKIEQQQQQQQQQQQPSSPMPNTHSNDPQQQQPLLARKVLSLLSLLKSINLTFFFFFCD